MMLNQAQDPALTHDDRPDEFEATIAYAKPGQTYPIWGAAEITIEFEPHRVKMTNAHSLAEKPTLQREGFTLSRLPSKVSDFDNADEIETTYFDEIAQHIKELTGAAKVLPYPAYMYRQTNLDANWHPRKMPAGQGAHIDWVDETAYNFMSKITDPDAALKKYSRIAIYQSWRAISGAPLDFPMALTDGRSVKRDDTVRTVTRLPAGSQLVTDFDFQVGMASPDHRWLYYRDMEPEDVMIFQGYDLQSPGELNVLHTGFVDETAFGRAKPRKSIELRTFAFFD